MTTWSWVRRGGNWRGTCDRGFVLLDAHIIFDDSHAALTATAFFSDGAPASSVELRFRRSERTIAQLKTAVEVAAQGLARDRWVAQTRSLRLAKLASPENFAARVRMATEGIRLSRFRALLRLPALFRAERGLLVDRGVWKALGRAWRLMRAHSDTDDTSTVDGRVRNGDANPS